MALLLQYILVLIRVYSLLLPVYALLSWFPGGYESAFGRFVVGAVEPILRPFRRLHLVFGGLDWTVWIVMILLNLLTEWIYRIF